MNYQPNETVAHHRPLSANLPLYDRADHIRMRDDESRPHFPSVLRYTAVQLACLPDARPEQAPVGFRYRPQEATQVFEVTLLAGRAVDAGYELEREDEDPVRLRALATELRRVNHVNNWARDFMVDHTPAQLELIHTEISEAYRAQNEVGRIDELGDVIIRTLNLLRLLEDSGHTLPWSALSDEGLRAWFGGWEPLLLRLHDHTDQAMEAYRKVTDLNEAVEGVGYHLAHVVGLAWGGMLDLGAQAPMDVLTRLVRQNATRGLNHGGRRL